MKTLDELDALYEKAGIKEPWCAMRQGNQFLGAHYMPTARGVAASTIPQLPRPWNPHALVAFMRLDPAEQSRFTDEHADLIVALVNAWPEVRERLRRAERERDEAADLLRANGGWLRERLARVEEVARDVCTTSLLLDTTPTEHVKTIDARRRNLSTLCTSLRAALEGGE